MWLVLLVALQNEMSAKDVVEWVEAHSKHRFVYAAETGLPHKKIRVRKEDLDPAKAYEAGLALLKTVQLIAIRKEKAGVVEIHPAPIGGKFEVPVHTSVDQLPAADEFCTLVLRPRFVNPRDVQAILINTVGFPQNVLAMQDPPSVVITDYASNLRRLAALMAEFDRLREPLNPQIAARLDVDWLLRKYLDIRFDPLPAKAAARVPALLEALAADSVAGRETAARELKEMGPNVSPLLAASLASKDVEVKGRARALLLAWAEEWAGR